MFSIWLVVVGFKDTSKKRLHSHVCVALKYPFSNGNIMQMIIFAQLTSFDQMAMIWSTPYLNVEVETAC